MYGSIHVVHIAACVQLHVIWILMDFNVMINGCLKIWRAYREKINKSKMFMFCSYRITICSLKKLFIFSLSPYSFDVSPSCTDVPQITHDSIPIGAIPILASSTSDYQEAVSRTINGANSVYQGGEKMLAPFSTELHFCFVFFQNFWGPRKARVSPDRFV